MRRGAACGRERLSPPNGARIARELYVGVRVFARARLLSRLANLYESHRYPGIVGGCGVEMRVAEECLDQCEIVAGVEQVLREGVPVGMR